MFNKILIANRGEIAVRIMRTCNRMGINTVAVFSEADSGSVHRHMADESVYIGKSPAQQSYLNADRIIKAALDTGAKAIHPGYGFLSENAAFVRAVTEAGLVFIGPPVKAVQLMGDKIAAKELAKKAGLPIIPGPVQTIDSLEEALSVAEEIGYPVLLKPAAGGGGKGMRIVQDPAAMQAAFTSSSLEAEKAFDDARLFLEAWLGQSRHVEIQLLADSQGNIVHLGERGCSIQRHYQKIIEEAPAPGVDGKLRERMGKAACKLAKKAGYVNAGTVEFVLDANKKFYFLEMNTRLQVEHPVTEMVTGLDLVELQLRIADGEALPFTQEEIQIRGCAIEARVYAEDPKRDFIPSTGMITRYAAPRDKNVRVDSGIDIGSRVDVYYDSMLAKIIGWGETRPEANQVILEAMNAYHVEGLATNVDFISRLLSLPDFAKADIDTAFIQNHFEGGIAKDPPLREDLELSALVATLLFHARAVAVRESLKHMVSDIGATLEGKKQILYKCRSGKDTFEVILDSEPVSGRNCNIRVNGELYTTRIPYFQFFRRRLKLVVNGQTYRFRLRFEEPFIFISFNGIAQIFEVYTPREWSLVPYMPIKQEKVEVRDTLLCPMPGLVVDVPVQKGDRVFRGQCLVILESMKMESGVPSPIDGVVAEVLAQAGQAVEAGDILVRFEEKVSRPGEKD